jgi:hypothetical protein
MPSESDNIAIAAARTQRLVRGEGGWGDGRRRSIEVVDRSALAASRPRVTSFGRATQGGPRPAVLLTTPHLNSPQDPAISEEEEVADPAPAGRVQVSRVPSDIKQPLLAPG